MGHIMCTRAVAALLTLGLLAGCGSPLLQLKRPKGDPVKAADVASAIVDESGIVITAPLDLSAVVAALEAALPTTTGLSDDVVATFRGDFRADRRSAESGAWEAISDEANDSPGRIARYRVTRGSVAVVGGPDEVWFEAPLAVSGLVAELDARRPPTTLRACGCDGAAWCGREASPPARATVRFTPFVAEGDGGLPSLGLRPEVIPEERCVSGLTRGGAGVDITGRALAPMTLSATSAAEAGGAALRRSAALDALIAPVSASLGAETPLADGMLRLQPSRVRLRGLTRLDAGTAATVEISLRPEWRGADTPPPEVPLVDATSRFRDAFEVAVPLRIDAGTLSAPLASALAGLELSKVGHRHAIVEAVDVYGSAGRAVVAVRVWGSVPGTVYLTGDVHVDPALATLSFERLDFTGASSRAISQLYDHYQRRQSRWTNPEPLKLKRLSADPNQNPRPTGMPMDRFIAPGRISSSGSSGASSLLSARAIEGTRKTRRTVSSRRRKMGEAGRIRWLEVSWRHGLVGRDSWMAR
jgi:hypothetical protein